VRPTTTDPSHEASPDDDDVRAIEEGRRVVVGPTRTEKEMLDVDTRIHSEASPPNSALDSVQ